MPFINLEQRIVTRENEHKRLNPGYLNISSERQFVPVKGVTYIWALTAKQEVIIGIERPWNHPEAFEVNLENPAERVIFEHMMRQLGAPSNKQADTLSFGHPTLTAMFAEAGDIIDDAAAYIGGEFSFNEDYQQWVVNNFSGRLGRFEPSINPIDPAVEKDFQERVLKTLYVAVHEFTKHSIFPCLSPRFIDPHYDPYCLKENDLFHKLRNSIWYYEKLTQEHRCSPHFVSAFIHNDPNLLKVVDKEFFSTHQPEAYALLSQLILNNHEEALITAIRFAAAHLDMNLFNDVLKSKKDALFSKEHYISSLYPSLSTTLRSDLDFANAWLSLSPNLIITNVPSDFFILHPKEASDMLDKAPVDSMSCLLDKFRLNNDFLIFAREYLIKRMHRGFTTPRDLLDILYASQKASLNLNQLNMDYLVPYKALDSYNCEKILELLPEEKQHEFAAKVIHPQFPIKLYLGLH